MLPGYYVIEALRIANERQAEADRASQAHLARQGRDQAPNLLRRTGARAALAVGRQSIRIARVLDECVADGAAATAGPSPLG
ncbi:MAG: hypothetical protein ACHQXL_01340 [Candidatus Limnocylindrales bacterium]|jgi:hypothetical protein